MFDDFGYGKLGMNFSVLEYCICYDVLRLVLRLVISCEWTKKK